MAFKLLPAVLAVCALASPALADPLITPCVNMMWKACNRQDYSSGDLDGWNTARILNAYSASIVSANSLPDVAGPIHPMNVIRFELRHGDHVSDGYRSE